MDIWLNDSSFRLKGKLATATLNQDGVLVEDKQFSGPGEYESKGVMITGVKIGQNLAYSVVVDGLNVVFLSSSETLDKEKLEELDEVDILLTPTSSVVADLEPKIIVPFGDDLSKLLKELGAEGISAQQKLSVTKDKLPEEPTVVVLDYAK